VRLAKKDAELRLRTLFSQTERLAMETANYPQKQFVEWECTTLPRFPSWPASQDRYGGLRCQFGEWWLVRP